MKRAKEKAGSVLFPGENLCREHFGKFGKCLKSVQRAKDSAIKAPTIWGLASISIIAARYSFKRYFTT